MCVIFLSLKVGEGDACNVRRVGVEGGERKVDGGGLKQIKSRNTSGKYLDNSAPAHLGMH